MIVNAANGNLPVHFINHSDRDVVVPKHTYVEAMEKVQESDRDNLSTNATQEPVSQHALSECLAHSGLLPTQRQSMHTLLQENSAVFRSSMADLSSTPLVQHYVDTDNAKPILQRAYCTSHHHCQEIEKEVEGMLCNGIIEPSVSPWASPIVVDTKADNTL